MSAKGYDIIWFSDLVTIRKGRALVDMAFGRQGEPIAASEQQRLTDIVLQPISADLRGRTLRDSDVALRLPLA